MNAKPGFIFGGNTPWSYEELQRKRGIADQLLQANSRTPQNVGEGIAAIGRALASRSLGKKADKREGELRSEFSNDFNSKLGGILGGNASPSYASPGSFAPASPNQDIADDTMVALGKPVQRSGGEWLQYSNQGATRNKPLNERLVSALSFLPEMGITMNVASGGQEAKGQGTRRTGSTRHDHGNAADADFYMDGRKLDWNNPNDIPVLQDIVKRARANGVTGFGAGDDYMGAGRMHIGFGDEAVWGANGKGENAPDWLRSAYYGAEPGGSLAPGPGTQVAQGGGQGGGMQGILDIANLMSNPMATPGQKAVMSALLQQKMAAMQPQSEMEALQMQKLEAEIQRMQKPEPVDPFAGIKEVNGQLVRMGDDGQPSVVGDFRTPDDPSAPTTKNVTMPDGSEAMVQWNPETQQWDAAPIPEGGTSGSGGSTKLTESQSKLTLFQTLQNETQPVLLSLETQFDPSNFSDPAAARIPIAGNYFTSPEYQMYKTAAAAWAEGALRIATGAAATQPEIERNIETYFAQPGDTPQTVAFKAQMREMYSRAVNNSLGKPMSNESLPVPTPQTFADQIKSDPPSTGAPDSDGWIEQDGVQIREKK